MQMVYNDEIMTLTKITNIVEKILKKNVEGMSHKYLDISNLNIIVSGKSNQTLVKDMITSEMRKISNDQL